MTTKISGQSAQTPLPAPALPARRVTLAGHSFDHLYVKRPRVWLAVIMLAYLLVATLYAVNTPAWQAPDEPAHYNYIAHIAKTGTLPVLEMGDYNQSTLELLLRYDFAPKFPVTLLQYENYQPPLYYISAVPIFWLTDGDLTALRLYSVFLGAVAIVLLYLCLELVFPQKELIGVTAAAFAAMLPMHVAMTASVNNDVMSEVLLMATFLALLHWMHGRYYGSAGAKQAARPLLLIGILLGLGMLTKFYAYLLLPIVALIVLLVAWRRPRVEVEPGADFKDADGAGAAPGGFGQAIGQTLWVIIPPLLMSLPVWLRNMRLYGVLDPLGLTRHDAVVKGQPTTAEWIAHNGWVAYGERAFSFTFKSFWGVFGWMGVFMDERIYTALLIFTGVIFFGLLWATVRLISGPPDTDMDLYQTHVQAFFAFMLVVLLLAYVGYNTKFVQHQGRYFFWGLLPISAMVAIGWREVLQPIQGAITGFLAIVLAFSLALTSYVGEDPDRWPVLMLTLTALMLLLQPLLLAGTDDRTIGWLPAGLQRFVRRPFVARVMGWLRIAAWSIPFLLLFALNLAIPHVYIVPQLTP